MFGHYFFLTEAKSGDLVSRVINVAVLAVKGGWGDEGGGRLIFVAKKGVKNNVNDVNDKLLRIKYKFLQIILYFFIKKQAVKLQKKYFAHCYQKNSPKPFYINKMYIFIQRFNCGEIREEKT